DALTKLSLSSAETELDKRWLLCPSGWTAYSGRCYRYIPRYLTWARAEKNCLRYGGHLASIRNIWEYRKIQQVIFGATHVYRQAWIGGSDAQEERQWFWSDGKPFVYQYWCHGEPNNHGNQDCLQINHGAHKCWDDRQCYHRLPSVCTRKYRILGVKAEE
ncbi:ladderlectin-like, partial [Plectropomus leopardus]|uniref:ladderlectin-like n=1 Tax=Plectropomus leopardus TaxID=160734 RepID=UPI001C4B0136